MDAFSLQGLDRDLAFGQFDHGVAAGAVEGGFDAVGVGALGQVAAGAEFDRFDRGGDAGAAVLGPRTRI